MLIKFIKQSWLVIVAALVFGLLVAVVHGTLKPRIDFNARQKLEREMKALLVGAQTFEDVTDQDGKMLYSVGKDADEQVLGYALQATGSGFADKILLLVALNDNLDTLLGFAVLKSNETPGFGDKIKNEDPDGNVIVKKYFKDRFRNRPVDKKLTVIPIGKPQEHMDDEVIVAISGATVSSEAVAKIVNDAIIKMREMMKK